MESSNDSSRYLEPKVNDLEPRGYGTVHFTSDPSGARIYVDGIILTNPEGEALRTPATTRLLEGRRDFVLSVEGYEDASGYVDVMANVSGSVNRNLKKGTSGGGWGKPQPQINLQDGPNNVDQTGIEFARILGAEIVSSSTDLCVASRMRNINVTIQDIPSNSPLTLAARFSYESQDDEGIALCLGETVVLEEEAGPLELYLRKVNVEVASFGSHWLFTDPPLYYIHFLSVEHPLTFAMKIGSIFSVLLK